MLRHRSQRRRLGLDCPYLPAARPSGRPRTTDLRAVLNAIFYLLRTGCQWRLLAPRVPAPGTVYHYFRAGKDVGNSWRREFILAEAAERIIERNRLRVLAVDDNKGVTVLRRYKHARPTP